jgi:hypothetical protein
LKRLIGGVIALLTLMPVQPGNLCFFPMKRFLVFPYWLFWILVGVNTSDLFLYFIDAGKIVQADWRFVDNVGRFAAASWMLVALVGELVKLSKTKMKTDA